MTIRAHAFSAMLISGTLMAGTALHAAPPRAQAVTAIAATRFLDSLGIDSTFPDRGQPIAKTVQMIKYCGFRWVRGGIEGLSAHGPTTVQTYLTLHRQTGVKFSWGLVSGSSDLKKLIATAKPLARAGALLAFEGNNEPNNWPVTYKGRRGGGMGSWIPLAELQRDLYRAVKSDPLLKKYPVWDPSEVGAETGNVGMQFLTIPKGAHTLMPAGTRYADYANCHNYIYHPNSPNPMANKTWNAADPGPACRVDGLYGNYGRTWRKGYRGYTQARLDTLPRVTTETGTNIHGRITEKLQALNLLSMYLDQFKRGWSYTSVYILRDRTDESGNQTFGFFRPDYKPRTAAIYMHNLTTIVADRGRLAGPDKLRYAIADQPRTVHDMLLENSRRIFQLVIWDERLKGSDHVHVDLGHRFSAVKIYDPTIGTAPIRTARGVSRLELTLSNHPLILEMPAK